MIPKDWKDITIETYTKLYPTFNTEDMTDTEIVDNKIKQLSIIKGISLEDASNCTVKEAEQIKALLETPLPTKIVKRFKHFGITYQFNIDANDLNGGGYIGIMNAIKDDPVKNMHVSMFHLAKPVKYSVWRSKFVPYEFAPSEVPKRMEEFKQLPISIAYPIAVFFSALSKALTGVTQDYLSQSLEILKKSLKETKEDLVNGDGR